MVQIKPLNSSTTKSITQILADKDFPYIKFVLNEHYLNMILNPLDSGIIKFPDYTHINSVQIDHEIIGYIGISKYKSLTLSFPIFEIRFSFKPDYNEYIEETIDILMKYLEIKFEPPLVECMLPADYTVVKKALKKHNFEFDKKVLNRDFSGDFIESERYIFFKNA